METETCPHSSFQTWQRLEKTDWEPNPEFHATLHTVLNQNYTRWHHFCNGEQGEKLHSTHQRLSWHKASSFNIRTLFSDALLAWNRAKMSTYLIRSCFSKRDVAYLLYFMFCPSERQMVKDLTKKPLDMSERGFMQRSLKVSIIQFTISSLELWG